MCVGWHSFPGATGLTDIPCFADFGVWHRFPRRAYTAVGRSSHELERDECFWHASATVQVRTSRAVSASHLNCTLWSQSGHLGKLTRRIDRARVCEYSGGLAPACSRQLQLYQPARCIPRRRIPRRPHHATAVVYDRSTYLRRFRDRIYASLQQYSCTTPLSTITASTCRCLQLRPMLPVHVLVGIYEYSCAVPTTV